MEQVGEAKTVKTAPFEVLAEVRINFRGEPTVSVVYETALYDADKPKEPLTDPAPSLNADGRLDAKAEKLIRELAAALRDTRRAEIAKLEAAAKRQADEAEEAQWRSEAEAAEREAAHKAQIEQAAKDRAASDAYDEQPSTLVVKTLPKPPRGR